MNLIALQRKKPGTALEESYREIIEDMEKQIDLDFADFLQDEISNASSDEACEMNCPKDQTSEYSGVTTQIELADDDEEISHNDNFANDIFDNDDEIEKNIF